MSKTLLQANSLSVEKGHKDGQFFIDQYEITDFICLVPEYNIEINVITFNISKEQKRVLTKLAKNIYKFQRYAHTCGIKTAWSDPLIHLAYGNSFSEDFYNKICLIFEYFRVGDLNENPMENMLLRSWLGRFTPENINHYCDKFGINPNIYCDNIYNKSVVMMS